MSHEDDRDRDVADGQSEDCELTMAQWRREFLLAGRPLELLRFFSDFGLLPEYLAMALGGVSSRSVRRWLQDGLPSTEPATTWRRLDDLRAIIGRLLADGTYDRAGIVAWLCSRQAGLSYKRPIDMLGRGSFEEVLALAEQMTGSARADDQRLQYADPDHDEHPTPRERRSAHDDVAREEVC
jgi:hypothetical protein